MKNRFILPLALACVLAGCSTTIVSWEGGNFATTAMPPVGVNIPGGPAAGVIVTVAALAAVASLWRDAPAMLEGRAISEVDCTQPIADWSKNLKCR